MDMLKDLRYRSGAPIVECKKALQSSNNNLEAAMDWLREHGAAKASSKVEGRDTTEGLVSLQVSDDGRTASIVKIASETDFAGRSSKFVELIVKVADATLNSSQSGSLSSEETLSAVTDGKTVKDLLDEAIVAIRENLNVVDAVKLTSEEGFLVGYVHNRVDGSGAGTSASLVELQSIPGKSVALDKIREVGKKLAMHVVAARPVYLSPSSIDEDTIDKERKIHQKQLSDSGKPPEIVTKIVEGKLRKFYEEVCLTEQGHMIEEKNPKVSKVLAGEGLQLKNYLLLSI